MGSTILTGALLIRKAGMHVFTVLQVLLLLLAVLLVLRHKHLTEQSALTAY